MESTKEYDVEFIKKFIEDGKHTLDPVPFNVSDLAFSKIVCPSNSRGKKVKFEQTSDEIAADAERDNLTEITEYKQIADDKIAEYKQRAITSDKLLRDKISEYDQMLKTSDEIASNQILEYMRMAQKSEKAANEKIVEYEQIRARSEKSVSDLIAEYERMLKAANDKVTEYKQILQISENITHVKGKTPEIINKEDLISSHPSIISTVSPRQSMELSTTHLTREDPEDMPRSPIRLGKYPRIKDSGEHLNRSPSESSISTDRSVPSNPPMSSPQSPVHTALERSVPSILNPTLESPKSSIHSPLERSYPSIADPLDFPLERSFPSIDNPLDFPRSPIRTAHIHKSDGADSTSSSKPIPSVSERGRFPVRVRPGDRLEDRGSAPGFDERETSRSPIRLATKPAGENPTASGSDNLPSES